MINTVTRRAAIAIASVQTLLTVRPAMAATPTPAQTSGPFYPPQSDRFDDQDWDLVKIEGQVREAGGEILNLFGEVLDFNGNPVAGAVVEIWQCDANGRYLHSADSADGPRDPAFQGFGKVVTGEEGRYRFRTIRPVAYPGRTPHIHARVVRPDGRELVTQIYVLNEPANQKDWIFRSLGATGQIAASIDPVKAQDGDLAAGFNFVV